MKGTRAPDRRVLALDVRPHWLGFAVFHGPNQLLDFGVTRFALLESGELRLSLLVNRFRPATIVLRKLVSRSRRDQPRTRALLRFIGRTGRHSKIEVVFVPEERLWNYFSARDTRTKQEIASLLAKIFPELSWRLPPPRKTWQHEHDNMPIFDAAGVGMVYVGKAPDAVGGAERVRAKG